MSPNDTTPNEHPDAPDAPDGPAARDSTDASSTEYENLRLLNGEVVVYVPENPDEWVQSDVAVPIPEVA